MAHISGYGELPARLATAVGLDPNNTQAFTIEVFPDDMIRVRSNQLTTENAVEQVATIFETAAEAGETPAVSQRPFIPVARLEDIRIRAAAGTLTNAERLALAVLAGGRNGEEGVPALIDAAQEEYSHGSYRVPVRVVGDKTRLKMVLSPAVGSSPISADHRNRILDALREWLHGSGQCVILPVGWSLRVFEVQADESQVEVSLGSTEGD